MTLVVGATSGAVAGKLITSKDIKDEHHQVSTDIRRRTLSRAGTSARSSSTWDERARRRPREANRCPGGSGRRRRSRRSHGLDGLTAPGPAGQPGPAGPAGPAGAARRHGCARRRAGRLEDVPARRLRRSSTMAWTDDPATRRSRRVLRTGARRSTGSTSPDRAPTWSACRRPMSWAPWRRDLLQGSRRRRSTCTTTTRRSSSIPTRACRLVYDVSGEPSRTSCRPGAGERAAAPSSRSAMLRCGCAARCPTAGRGSRCSRWMTTPAAFKVRSPRFTASERRELTARLKELRDRQRS